MMKPTRQRLKSNTRTSLALIQRPRNQLARIIHSLNRQIPRRVPFTGAAGSGHDGLDDVIQAADTGGEEVDSLLHGAF